MSRVLFMTPLPPPITGQSLACQSALDALRGQPGVEIDVVDIMKGHLAQGFTSFRHALRVLGFACKGRRLGRRADVIYMNPSQSIPGNLKDLLIFFVMGRKSVAKVVFHLHGGGIRKTVYERSRLLRWLNRRALSRMRHLVVEGESLRAAFAGMTTVDQIRVVPNFAAEDLYLDPAAVEAKFAADGPLEVLYLSNFNPEKGSMELLGAAEALHESGVDGLRFTFAGGFVGQAQEGEVRRRIEALPSARLLGVIDGAAKQQALARAHVLCLPSYYPYEGQPLCLIEAQASGCVLVTTDQGGIRDVFEDGVNGYETGKRSQTAVEATLMRVLEERAGLVAVARHNRQAAERYRESAYRENMLELLLPGGVTAP